jgi:hypothetical protein
MIQNGNNLNIKKYRCQFYFRDMKVNQTENGASIINKKVTKMRVFENSSSQFFIECDCELRSKKCTTGRGKSKN